MRLASTFVLHGFQIGYPAFITWLAAAMASQVIGSEVVFYLGAGSLVLVGLEYGFRYSGAREISLALENPARIAEVIGAIMLVQTGFFFAALLAAFVAIGIAGPSIGVATALCVLVFMVLNGIIPTWIFIALSLQREFLLLTAPVRLAGLGVALVAYHFHSIDGLFLSQCGAILAIHLSGLLLLHRKGYFALSFRPKLAASLLREGRDIFVMKLGVFSYTSAGVLILGIVQSPEIVGAFGLCQRLVTAMQQGSAPLFMTAYPLSVRYASGERELATRLLRLNGTALLFSVGMSLVIALGGPALLTAIGLDHYEGITRCILIMAPLPALVGLSTLLVNNAVLAAKRDTIVRQVTLTTGAIGIPAYFAMTRLMGLFGAAATLTIIEACVALAYLTICIRENLLSSLFYWRSAHES
ncbi:lipopolysaccharide biosynthesis protein [Novosphingobium aerophilum]|uniref:lipopolysaccharide biosynthesis protein n=1 Tax=Novosphingobium TaxID=165696 RepID=UPI002D78F4EA|nr:hypothetical protein [Novosphingobium sp. RL4]WRT95311.1 hypothetical protein U9J33_24355 [Novosphingobium sp. RL4]